MQILVIGKNGQVAKALHANSPEKLIFTQLSSEEINLEDDDSIRDALYKYHSSIDHAMRKVIINAAAYTNVEEAETFLSKAMQINGSAPGVIANFAKEYGYEFVHYSTDYVFDGTKNSPYLESDATNPINIYGKSKLLGEYNVQASGCDYLIARTSWIFSETGVNFVKKIMNLLQERDEIKVISDQEGRPSYAGFIAESTYKLLSHNICNKEIINICQPDSVSWYGFACKIKENLELRGIKAGLVKQTSSDEFKTKAKRPKNSVLSIDKLDGIIGGNNIHSWEISLKHLIDNILQENGSE